MRWLPLVLIACSAPPRVETAAEPSRPVPVPVPVSVPEQVLGPAITISVTELPATDSWSITWQLERPAPAIIFDRRNPSNRHETWVPGDGLRWDHDPTGDYETLRSSDGKPRAELTATFPSDLRAVGRVPSLNVRFTDGSRLLFTAQVGAYPFVCDPRCDRIGREASRRWIFHTAAERSLRVVDRAGTGELIWNEPAGDVRGTYLYAGTIAPTHDERVTLVSDPGLPAWLVADTTRLLPELFAFHGESTGVTLDFVPLVLASHTEPAARGDALRGKSLPGLIQLEAIGKDWSRATADRRRRWFEVLAHEAFHLWNAQLARRSGDKRDEWLSEGSAVFMAGLALRDAGLLTARAYEDRILDAANGCVATLRGPLFAETADASYYACGELVHFLVDRALADVGGVVGVWAKTIAHARTSGAYSTADFLAFVDAPIAVDVRQILDVGLGTDPAAHVQRLLGAARLPTKLARHGRMLVRRR